jgi:uncharacterized protein
MTKFEIYADKSGKGRWRLKASNGETVATSEAYATLSAARDSAEKMKEWTAHAKIEEIK